MSVFPPEAGMRLDLFILEFSQHKNLGLSRTFIQKLLKEGKISLTSFNRVKPNYKVKAGEEIKIQIEKKDLVIAAENISLEVVYEDECLAIINKPSGLVVHPAPGNYEHTLVNALLHYFS